MKRIVLISSGQPSVNPRLVKEANALSDEGFEVFVLYSFWTQWAWETDKQLFSKCKWTPILVGGSPNYNKLRFHYTRIRFKFANLISKKLTLGFGFAEISKGRAYCELLSKAKSIKGNLYIAHNLAALPVAVKAAKYNSSKCGFDIEDFHRHEVTDNINDYGYIHSKFIEDKYLEKCDYHTAASTLIAEEYKKLYETLSPIVINNVFETKNNHFLNKQSNDRLKIFWFSQVIGKKRGIEDAILALNMLNNPFIELHLLGNINSESLFYFKGLVNFDLNNIFFHTPISPDKIFEFSSRFDIGLALEPGFCINNNIALSNKIFTYMQSGLAIIASDTLAQKQFMNENQEIGYVYPIGNAAKLAEVIQTFYTNRDLLKTCQKNATDAVLKVHNWEKESQKLISKIKCLI